jgi:type IV secretion system protein VirD4
MNSTTPSDRSAYAGKLVLTSTRRASMDAWETGLNNNVLVLGSSGSGKTRNFLKPNLLQCAGSYVVLDSKGRLYQEMAPYLFEHGYKVDRLDFTTMEGTLGYDPLHHVRWSHGRPLGQDIVGIASALFPREEMGQDPFWASAAANYLASYIAYVFEALPDREWNMASVVSVFEQACTGDAAIMFGELSKQDPQSYAAKLFRRARTTARAEKMHASIMGIIAASIFPLTFDEALASFRRPDQVDFCALGHERHALFVTMDDMDHSLAPLTSLFVRQAFQALCAHADAKYEGGRLPVPVRFMLDDFANLSLPGIDDVLSVIRSREISCTLVCQTVSQLDARYGEPTSNSIIGNCDRQLVLGFQDERTARYFSTRANRTPSSLLETPAGSWWYFERGQRGVCEPAYDLGRHPAYGELLDLGRGFGDWAEIPLDVPMPD